MIEICNEKIKEYPSLIWKGRMTKNTSGIYSDRLYEWDSEKFNKCTKEIFGNTSQYFHNRKPADIEKFLCKYLNKDIELVSIEQHENAATGYPYWYFAYKEKELELEFCE